MEEGRVCNGRVSGGEAGRRSQTDRSGAHGLTVICACDAQRVAKLQRLNVSS